MYAPFRPLLVFPWEPILTSQQFHSDHHLADVFNTIELALIETQIANLLLATLNVY